MNRIDSSIYSIMMQQKDKKIQQLATKLVEAEEKIEQLESRLTRHL